MTQNHEALHNEWNGMILTLLSNDRIFIAITKSTQPLSGVEIWTAFNMTCSRQPFIKRLMFIFISAMLLSWEVDVMTAPVCEIYGHYEFYLGHPQDLMFKNVIYVISLHISCLRAQNIVHMYSAVIRYSRQN